jgi:hypothetical protein
VHDRCVGAISFGADELVFLEVVKVYLLYLLLDLSLLFLELPQQIIINFLNPLLHDHIDIFPSLHLINFLINKCQPSIDFCVHSFNFRICCGDQVGVLSVSVMHLLLDLTVKLSYFLFDTACFDCCFFHSFVNAHQMVFVCTD